MKSAPNMKANHSNHRQPGGGCVVLEISSKENITPEMVKTNWNPGNLSGSSCKDNNINYVFRTQIMQQLFPLLEQMKILGVDSSIWTKCENCDGPKSILLDPAQVWQQLSHLNNCTKFSGWTASGSVRLGVKTPLQSHHTYTLFSWKKLLCYICVNVHFVQIYKLCTFV